MRRSVLNCLLPSKGHLNVVKAQQSSVQRRSIATSEPKETPRVLSAAPVPAQSAIITRLKAIIAEETGLDISHMDIDASFVELGIDSLLSITISSRAQDELGLNMSPSHFVDFPTLNDVVSHFAPSDQEASDTSDGLLPSPDEKETDLGDDTDATSVASEPEVIATVRATTAKEVGITIEQMDATSPPHATSVRLHGSSEESRGILWLFPDGAGSASSYSTLPAMSPGWAVYCLNCPWLKTPQNLRCSLPEYVSKFLVEIRRRQPFGPYSLGGWSAGGILAFEAAQQLARQGQTTAKLILLDSPNPIGIQSPPQAMYDFLESLDLFGMKGREPPEWLRPHFTAFVSMLDRYLPVPFSSHVGAPLTRLIYARDGLCKNPEDPRPVLSQDGADDTREMTWLLNNRTNFKGEGWKGLVGEENLRVSVVDQVNHYTMLRRAESVATIGQLMASHLDS